MYLCDFKKIIPKKSKREFRQSTENASKRRKFSAFRSVLTLGSLVFLRLPSYQRV